MIAAWFLVGTVTSMAVAWAIAFNAPGRIRSEHWASAAVNGRSWSVAVWSGLGWTIVRGGTPRPPAWSPAQAAGPPDTTGFGDLQTAWASKTPDGQVEWLRLDFDRPVVPRAVEVHETYNPGALTMIKGIHDGGAGVTLWSGADPTQPGSRGGVSVIDLDARASFGTIVLTIDSPSVAGWNEIDAVALVDEAGARHWATGVSASSTYAMTPPASAGPPEALRPWWCRSVIGPAVLEDRVAVATGWPLRMIMAVRTESASHPASGIQRGFQGGGLPIVESIPSRPIWGGLLVNGALFGTAAWLLALALGSIVRRPVHLMHLVREAWRTRQGRCAQCGFDLRFDLARGCPECGWRRAAALGHRAAP